MKIINIMLGKELGGLEQVALDYHFNLTKRGHKVLTILREGAKLDVSSLNPAEVVYFKPSKVPFFTAYKLKNLIINFEADIALAHGKRPLSLLKNMRLPCPRVFIVHNYRSKPDCLKMDHCIAVSSSVRDHVLSLGFPEQNCHVVHNMTDMTTVKTNTDLANTPVFGTISRLHTNKGIDIFLKAFKILRDQNILARAVIAGSGPEEEKLKALTKQLGLVNDVKFIGWVTDKKQFYANLDVFVLPSRVEPFGITVIEAMAAGVPMIITDCAGPISFVRDGKEAYIVPRENEVELSSAMYNILEDNHLRHDIQYNQAVTAKQFTPDAVTTKLESILNYIVQNKSGN